MFRSLPIVALAALLGSQSVSAAEGESYVSLQVDGCADKCAEFEIQIYDNGRLLFKPNNSKNSTKSPLSKNGIASIYARVSTYLQNSGALTQPTECTGSADGKPVAIVTSSQNGQVQKATWSAGCANQLEKGRSLVKVFVNQSGFWRNINKDSRYWEKYWETWEEKK